MAASFLSIDQLHLLSLGLGLILLLAPGAVFFPQQRGHLPLSKVLSAKAASHSIFFLHPVVWLDGARAYAAASLLLHFSTSFPAEPSVNVWRTVYAVILLLIGLLLQLRGHKTDDLEMHAPVSYVAGLLLGLFPPGVALPSLVLGGATAVLTRRLGWGLFFLGVGVLVMALLLRLPAQLLLPVGIWFALVQVLLIASSRKLVLPVPRQLIERMRQADPRYASRLR